MRDTDSAKTRIEGYKFSRQGFRFSRLYPTRSGIQIQPVTVQKDTASPARLYPSTRCDIFRFVKASANSLLLFDERDLMQVRPTGSPWKNNPKDPATVPVPLQVVMVKIDGPYTERDRKLWIFLLHAVWDDLETKTLHELSVTDINRVFREVGGDHNAAWIWESAKRLAKTSVEWEYTLGDERLDGVSSIFGAVLSRPARQAGKLIFNFPPLLIPIIKQPHRFARLRVHFMIGLSGKYAVTLYELLEGFANRRDGRFECSIAELRQWLKVPDGTYQTWKNFKLRVLDPSIEQINGNAAGAGFTVSYRAIREGRFYDRVAFALEKTTGREQAEGRIKKRIRIGKSLADAKAKSRPPLLPGMIERAATLTGRYLDMAKVEAEFWTHWEATDRPDFIKGVEAAFIGFTRRKLRQVKYGETPRKSAS